MPPRRELLIQHREAAGLSQERLAEVLGVDRSTVQRWEAGSHAPQPWRRAKLANALAVALPELDRLLRGVGPAAAPQHGDVRREDRNATAGTLHREVGIGRGAVDRRHFVAVATEALLGLSLTPSQLLTRVAHTFGSDPGLVTARPGRHDDLDLLSLTRSLAVVKQAYQECEYGVITARLPQLLSHLEVAGVHVGQGRGQHLSAVRSHAYHLVASVLFKLGKTKLAIAAAQHSMEAARQSQDPLAICASGRIVTQALTSTGHQATAAEYAEGLAIESETSVAGLSPDTVWLSVYGSLLLRGAMAASQREDTEQAALLLDEAEGSAARLGGDYNHEWTAFGPANVQAHRVAAEVNLGNAGRAVKSFQSLDLDSLRTPERKATVLVDLGRAYVQWNKHQLAVDSLWQAADLAPQELRKRPAVRQLVDRMEALAPPSDQESVAQLSARIGTAA